MSFSAKIIADSISPLGVRLTTLELCYPRFIHSEFMTHRAFSRNAASSRAIPVAKMIEQVRENPAMPVFWGKNQPGMQAAEEVDFDTRSYLKDCWENAAHEACDRAARMSEHGAHKQIVNRLLEPWMWMKTIVTATDWDNFFALRCHPDAQPEFQKLANLIRSAMTAHPTPLDMGEWHLPYVSRRWGRSNTGYNEPDGIWCRIDSIEDAIKCSVARCARVSYLTHDGEHPSVEKDLALYDRLVGSVPRHSSPAEHQATPSRLLGGDPTLWGNFYGWNQYRRILEAQS